MVFLVTGAAGFVGSHLLDLLVDRGARVVGWHRGNRSRTLRDDVEWNAVELLDRDAVTAAIRQVEPSAVYHLAGWAHPAHSWKNPLETYQNNVLATHHLLSALRRTVPNARVLVTCSGTIYAPQNRALTEDDPIAPATPYAVSKLAQEMLAARAYNDDQQQTLIARSFNHTGPRQDASYVASAIARQIARIEAGLQEPILRLGNLEPKRDLSDVRDVVRAYVEMMASARPGKPYNVCSGRHLAIRELVELFVARARTSVTVVQDPALVRANDVPMLVGDYSRLTADTGWTPAIPLEKTVNDLLDFWRAHPE